MNERKVGRVDVSILLGSGLSGVIDWARIQFDFHYRDIEGYPPTKIPGHPGRLVIGDFGEKRCAIFVGRSHGYEGVPAEVLTLPVQVAAGLGAKTMVLSNSVGGLNPDFAGGDIMLVQDHINFMGVNPLVEMIRNYDGNPFEAGQPTPFVNMVDAYRADLYPQLRDRLAEQDIKLHLGVLAVVLGPNYETATEVRMLRSFGADAVCMSTVPETIYARYAGLKVVALAFVTNLAHDGSEGEHPTHEHVLHAAKSGSEDFAFAVQEAVKLI